MPAAVAARRARSGRRSRSRSSRGMPGPSSATSITRRGPLAPARRHARACRAGVWRERVLDQVERPAGAGRRPALDHERPSPHVDGRGRGRAASGAASPAALAHDVAARRPARGARTRPASARASSSRSATSRAHPPRGAQRGLRPSRRPRRRARPASSSRFARIARERRAQLVRRVGHELALAVERRLGLGARRVERREHLLERAREVGHLVVGTRAGACARRGRACGRSSSPPRELRDRRASRAARWRARRAAPAACRRSRRRSGTAGSARSCARVRDAACAYWR